MHIVKASTISKSRKRSRTDAHLCKQSSGGHVRWCAVCGQASQRPNQGDAEWLVDGAGGGVGGGGQVVHDGDQLRDQDPRHPNWQV